MSSDPEIPRSSLVDEPGVRAVSDETPAVIETTDGDNLTPDGSLPDSPLPVEAAATRPPRRRIWWMTFLAWAILLIVLATFGTIFIALPIMGDVGSNYNASPEQLAAQSRLPVLGASAFIWLWVVFFGASFGSFINCVAWRLPRGISVSARGSACPRCGKRLRWNENVPLYGWLRLNAQCGSCNEPIPARYFLVEVVFALSFCALVFGEIVSGGIAIPFRQVSGYTGVLWKVMYPDWPLWRICGFHWMVTVLLWLWALLSWDRHRVPVKAIAIGLGLAILVPALWADVLPVDFRGQSTPVDSGIAIFFGGAPHAVSMVDSFGLPEWSLGLVTSFAGAATGFAIGLLASLGQSGSWRRINLTSGFAIVGAAVGWQGVISVALINAVVLWLARLLPAGARRQAAVLSLPVAFLLHVLSWSIQPHVAIWPGPAADWPIYLMAELIAIALHRSAWPSRPPVGSVAA